MGYFEDASYTCTRRLAADADFCGNASRFDVTTYLTPLLLARPTAQTSMVPIECATLTVRARNGTAIATVDCNNTSSEFALTCNTSTVENVVVEVHYSIERNFLGITGATVSFVVMESQPTAALPNAVVQKHRVTFQGEDTTAPTAATAVNTYPRSGYPGYITVSSHK